MSPASSSRARDYSFGITRKGRSTVGAAIQLAPRANALQVAKLVRERMEELGKKFPAGIEWAIPYDTSKYVEVSMEEVAKTLIEAMILVFLVVWLFLYNLRATIIPAMAVPVSFIGTFAGMYLLGFSINSLTLFGMVLSIGIVVDDAIVVLENVERHMRAEHVDLAEATRRAMGEVSRPVIAIVLVLNAVFLPVAFLGGLGRRDVSAVRHHHRGVGDHLRLRGADADAGNVRDAAEDRRSRTQRVPQEVRHRVHAFHGSLSRRCARGFWRHGAMAAALIVLMLGIIYVLQRQTPTALAPDEDQGYVIAIAALPPAASLQRTDAVLKQLDKIAFAHPAYGDNFTVRGLDVLTNAQRSNAGVSFIILKDWSDRKKKELSSAATAQALTMGGFGIKDGFIFSLAPPAIEGISNTGGFEGFIQARTGNDYTALDAATQAFVAAASQRKELAGLGTSYSSGVPRVQLNVDREKAKLLGVSMDDVNVTLQSTFGAFYVNDFNRDGRVYRVQLQSEGKFRSHPEDLRDVYVKSSNGSMMPLTAIAKVVETTGPDVIERFNLFPSARLFGGPAPGYSSGQALAVMEELAAKTLPENYRLAWSGQSYQEKTSSQNTAGIFGLAVLMVFLILAAQYERLTLPFAVILAVPFAVFGAFVAVWARGLYDDLYLQIGLVTLVGLAAKNAILIVEFAAHIQREQGKSLYESAVEAAHLRFRPIVMTSLAFILGVLPLAVSTGAGAASRHSIGTGVIGGMLAATFIAVLFIPLFFVGWTSTVGEKMREWRARRQTTRRSGRLRHSRGGRRRRRATTGLPGAAVAKAAIQCEPAAAAVCA